MDRLEMFKDEVAQKGIRIIVSEVDGVITDGSVAFDAMGLPLFKNFYLPDFEAINSLKRGGYIFVFLSSDNSMSYNLMRSKNIPFYWASADKTSVLNKILHKYKLSPDKLLYLGGAKPSDYKCMSMAAVSVAPMSASHKRNNTRLLGVSSGNGVITRLASVLSCY